MLTCYHFQNKYMHGFEPRALQDPTCSLSLAAHYVDNTRLIVSSLESSEFTQKLIHKVILTYSFV